MVYDGKPSKGCGNCRSRKIRCDRAPSACWQCIRTNRKCPGYRDELSLMFRDETQSVAHKARSVYSSATSLRRRVASRSRRGGFPQGLGSSGISDSFDVVFEFGSDPDPNFRIQGKRSPLRTHPNAGVSKQEAICYFLQSHSFQGNFLIKDALARFLVASGGSLGQQAIQSSIVAVASAMLSRVRRAGALSQTARKEYGSALGFVNRALADPHEAKTNQTLGAIVLLSLYEVSASLPRKEATYQY